jgi:arginase
MNVSAAAAAAEAVSQRVADALSRKSRALVLGGDCSVELGTVAGALTQSENIGLIYVDLDVDLNTPDSTTDGALDWMGVAHLLGVKGSLPALAALGPRVPMLGPDAVLFFAHDNVTEPEREIINTYSIAECPLSQVRNNPSRVAQSVIQTWAHNFELLLVHLDVDVLDYLDMPLAENVRRNVGLRFSQLMEAMDVLLTAPNFSALTVCELNPDHGEADHSTLRIFNDALGSWLARSM